MPRNSKCSYCRNEGHTIRHCNSQEGYIFNDRIRSRAIDYIVLERQTIHERAKLFYKFLVQNCYLEELKLLLSRRECHVNGNKKQLAARFIHNYFILELGLCQFPGIISHTDRRHIRAYLTYWYNLSQGNQYVDRELNQYFDSINLLQSDNDNTYKFPINVVMKTIDLTEETLQQHFECAICMEEQCPILDQVVLGCNHYFCTGCVTIMLTNSKNKKIHPCCALCRTEFKKIQLDNEKIMEDYNTRFCYSC
jgi:hypothetical protein